MATKTDLLRSYNEARHQQTLIAVRAAIAAIYNRGEHVSFYRIAKETGLSKTTLYKNPDVKALIAAVRAEPVRMNRGWVSRWRVYCRRAASCGGKHVEAVIRFS